MGIEILQEQLDSLKPVLATAGRSIEILSAVGETITFKITGFCGGCECSGSYKEGLQDLVREHCPEYVNVEFIEE